MASGIVHVFACRVAEVVTSVLRHPVFILTFVPACLGFIALGWAMDAFNTFLLVITTVLSILASWQASMMLLKQGQQAGEVD